MQRPAIAFIIKINANLEDYYKIANTVRATIVSFLGTKYKGQTQYFFLRSLKSGSIIIDGFVAVP